MTEKIDKDTCYCFEELKKKQNENFKYEKFLKLDFLNIEFVIFYGIISSILLFFCIRGINSDENNLGLIAFAAVFCGFTIYRIICILKYRISNKKVYKFIDDNNLLDEIKCGYYMKGNKILLTDNFIFSNNKLIKCLKYDNIDCACYSIKRDQDTNQITTAYLTFWDNDGLIYHFGDNVSHNDKKIIFDVLNEKNPTIKIGKNPTSYIKSNGTEIVKTTTDKSELSPVLLIILIIILLFVFYNLFY